MENKLESYNTTQRVITNNGNINPVLADIPRRINNNQFSMQKRSFRFSLQALPAVWLILSSLQGFLLFTFSSPESCREVAVSLHTIISCLVSHLPPLSSTVAIFSWWWNCLPSVSHFSHYQTGWRGPQTRYPVDQTGPCPEFAGQCSDREWARNEHPQPPPQSPGSLRLPGHQQGGNHHSQRHVESSGQ